MFDEIEDYNLDGTEKKNYGCLIFTIKIIIILILFGVFIG